MKLPPPELPSEIPPDVAAILRFDCPASVDIETPEDKHARGELRLALLKGMAALKPAEQEALTFYYVEGWTFHELGRHRSVSHERARQYVSHALSKLRRSNGTGIGIAGGVVDEITLKEKWQREELARLRRAEANRKQAEAWQAERKRELAEKRRLLKIRQDEIKAAYAAEKPKTIPPKLHKLMTIIQSLTPEEVRAIRDWRCMCRINDCKSKANEYGYCNYHTEAMYGFRLPNEGRESVDYLYSSLAELFRDDD